jgi:hypothetical protein
VPILFLLSEKPQKSVGFLCKSAIIRYAEKTCKTAKNVIAAGSGGIELVIVY